MTSKDEQIETYNSKWIKAEYEILGWPKPPLTNDDLQNIDVICGRHEISIGKANPPWYYEHQIVLSVLRKLYDAGVRLVTPSLNEKELIEKIPIILAKVYHLGIATQPVSIPYETTKILSLIQSYHPELKVLAIKKVPNPIFENKANTIETSIAYLAGFKDGTQAQRDCDQAIIDKKEEG